MFDRLIGKVVDNEARPFEKKACKVLCNCFPKLQNLKSELERISLLCEKIHNPECNIQRDTFWNRFNQRVVEEVYLDKFYNREPLRVSKERKISKFFIPALGGVSACLLGFTIFLDQSGVKNQFRQQKIESAKFQEVHTGITNTGIFKRTGQSFSSLSSLPQKSYPVPSVSDVEWVRSPGRVNILKPQTNSSPILWVRKKEALYGSNVPMRIGRSFPSREFPQ